MQIGQSVKVKVRDAMEVNGHQIPEQWTRGAVKQVGSTWVLVGYGEYSSYTEGHFSKDKVVKYEPLSDAKHAENIATALPIGLALANELMAQFLPSSPLVTLEDETLVGYKGGITIDPTTIDERRVGGLIERTAWEVVSWSWEGGGRWHPEEKVDSAVGTYDSISKAVAAMIKAIFNMEVDGYLTSKADQAMAEAWVEDEKQGLAN
jgi:hypothetical protein